MHGNQLCRDSLWELGVNIAQLGSSSCVLALSKQLISNLSFMFREADLLPLCNSWIAALDKITIQWLKRGTTFWWQEGGDGVWEESQVLVQRGQIVQLLLAHDFCTWLSSLKLPFDSVPFSHLPHFCSLVLESERNIRSTYHSYPD